MPVTGPHNCTLVCLWHQANQKQQTVLHEKYGIFLTKSGRHECVPVIGVVLAAHVHQHHVLVLDLAVCGKGQSQCGVLRQHRQLHGREYMNAAQIHATAAPERMDRHAE